MGVEDSLQSFGLKIYKMTKKSVEFLASSKQSIEL